MTIFDERARAFEEQYHHDEDLRFRIQNRRNRLLGLWAAEFMGLSADAAETYAGAVATADLERAGDEDVLSKIAADAARRGLKITNGQLRRKAEQLLTVAEDQVKAAAAMD